MANFRKSLNLVILKVLSPILLGIGIINFFLPEYSDWISTHLYNNAFLIVAGLTGLVISFTKAKVHAKRFCFILGMAYFYFFVANFAGLFPAFEIDWRTLDDSVHLLMAMTFILAGIYGPKEEKISALPYLEL